MLPRLRAKLPIMSTFFSSSRSPKEAGSEVSPDLNQSATATTASPSLTTQNMLSFNADATSQNEGSSKPSSEKESTLVNESVRDLTTAEDTNKEAIPNEGAKEESGRNDTEKETTKEEAKTSSDDDAENKSAEPEPAYPTALRLLLITIALCLCVFCVALVCCPRSFAIRQPLVPLTDILNNHYRTTRSLQLPFPKSLINLTRSTMSVGTAVPTCSPLAPSL